VPDLVLRMIATMKRILVKVLGFVFLIIFLIYNYSTFKEYFHRMRLVHFV